MTVILHLDYPSWAVTQFAPELVARRFNSTLHPSRYDIYIVAVFFPFSSPRLQIELLCFSHVNHSLPHSITWLLSPHLSLLPSSWHSRIVVLTFQPSRLLRADTLINLMAWRRYNNAFDNIIDLSAEHYKSIEENLDILTLTQRVYKPNSERFQEWIKSLWYE